MKRSKLNYGSPLLCFLLLGYLHHSEAQPNTTGYTCLASSTTANYPCQTYVYYRANGPNFLDLASIADLFSISRLMISRPSNISSPSSPLLPDQSLFVPITCNCNSISNTSISYANLTYSAGGKDTFFLVSVVNYQNLTSYQSIELVNPSVPPTQLQTGMEIIIPIFCKCPNRTGNYFLTYVVQPSDNLSSVASRFGVTVRSLIDVNGDRISPYNSIFIPITQLPKLTQPPVVVPSAPPGGGGCERKAVISGLRIGLGFSGALLILFFGLWVHRGRLLKEREFKGDFDSYRGGNVHSSEEVNFVADVAGCLDKCRVFGIEELRKATNGYDQSCLIHGSVYKGVVDREVYAIKMMNWNACEELEILQKVNHGNLVKLEGFCIEPEGANCYLVYEFVENGSLHSWLHRKKSRKLSWKTRLRIAIDVANGLQYLHEHIKPRVVHKDIKSSNILLDRNMRAKIANFGLAKSGRNVITMHVVGTQGYIAPEYLAYGLVSSKIDVFSFGVVLLELISRKEAIDEHGRNLWLSFGGILEGKEDEKEKRLKEWMDDNLLKESCCMESIMNVIAVAVACVNSDPSKRPSMVDVVYALCKCTDNLFSDSSEDDFSNTSEGSRSKLECFLT